ncbi:MAG: hypothetical protein Q7T45_18025 [Bradyrhizobium sp.]|nr:hypothetical protein [Bradyrhizobium sp.]MDO8399715.1 hypothetical protein [Bradyrhizobium sp.]
MAGVIGILTCRKSAGGIARRIDFAAPRGHESTMKSISPIKNSQPHV